MVNDRDAGGRFAQGNAAAVGHGRPRLATERHFLRKVAERLDAGVFDAALTSWARAVQQGERWAVELAFRYALGPEPAALAELAADELNGVTPDLLLDADAQHLATAGGDAVAALLDQANGNTTRARALHMARQRAAN